MGSAGFITLICLFLGELVLCSSCGPILFGLGMLDSKTHELAALEIEGLVSHGECSLNSLGSVEFDIGNSLTAATTSVTNDADVSDLTAISLAEEVPDISFLGLEGETVNKDSVILSLGFLHLFL